MWPFKTRSPLSADDETWQLETWRWLLTELGGIDDLKRSELIVPTPAFFPPSDARGHQRAEHIFAVVKEHCGLSDWPCRLEAQPEKPDPKVSEVAYLKNVEGGLPAGSFGVDGNEVVITYDPGALSDPIALVATFAHELSHYLLSSKGEPPGGWDNHEFCTDLAVVYLGFGLFGAATAFRYFSGAQSWGYSRMGYLTQAEWTFALGVFFALRDQPVSDAAPWLAPHLRTGVDRASRYLAANPALLAALRS